MTRLLHRWCFPQFAELGFALLNAGGLERIDDFEQLAFFVIAPSLERRKHRNTNLEICTDHSSIRRNLSQRIAAYEDASRSEAAELRRWEANYFLPLIERLVSTNSLAVLSWENCIAAIAEKDEATSRELQSFYDRCLKYDPLPMP